MPESECDWWTSDYVALATQAAEKEQAGAWEEAFLQWDLAANSALLDMNRAWAQGRARFCRKRHAVLLRQAMYQQGRLHPVVM
ncbi:ANR family transcriptional regulator [Yersinia intermedia]|uniref:ANR family transcriptional regulator n=1 Tax=Yersinia intermedia TaxID=631 RepID=UPI0022FDB34D|nr:ANR family transcriptional regulator [Yersinia intermedia]MDA5483414.1 ANR family transcriptional regulator [Yersinia intermedia]